MTGRTVRKIFTRVAEEAFSHLPKDTQVLSMKIDRSSLKSEICLVSSAEINADMLPQIVSEIKKQYGFSDVRITSRKAEARPEQTDRPAPSELQPVGRSGTEPKKEKKRTAPAGYTQKARKKADIRDENLIFGKIYQEEPAAMNAVSLERRKNNRMRRCFFRVRA